MPSLVLTERFHSAVDLGYKNAIAPEEEWVMSLTEHSLIWPKYCWTWYGFRGMKFHFLEHAQVSAQAVYICGTNIFFE